MTEKGALLKRAPARGRSGDETSLHHYCNGLGALVGHHYLEATGTILGSSLGAPRALLALVVLHEGAHSATPRRSRDGARALGACTPGAR